MTTYAGRTGEQRRAERRVRLLAAAEDLWVEQGWAAVTVRGVCARAGLVDRYFYESFSDREQLLLTVWERCRDEIAELVLAAAATAPDDPLAQLERAIVSVVQHFDRHPGAARMVLGDHVGSAVLGPARREALALFTDLLVRLASPYAVRLDTEALRRTAVMAIGAFVELVTAWKGGMIEADADTIVRHVTAVIRTLTAGELARPVRSSP